MCIFSNPNFELIICCFFLKNKKLYITDITSPSTLRTKWLLIFSLYDIRKEKTTSNTVKRNEAAQTFPETFSWWSCLNSESRPVVVGVVELIIFHHPVEDIFWGVFCRISVDVRRGNIYIQYIDIHFLKNTVKRHQTNMYSYIPSPQMFLRNSVETKNNIILEPQFQPVKNGWNWWFPTISKCKDWVHHPIETTIVASRFHPLFVGSKCRMKSRSRLQTTPGCYISGLPVLCDTWKWWKWKAWDSKSPSTLEFGKSNVIFGKEVFFETEIPENWVRICGNRM